MDWYLNSVGLDSEHLIFTHEKDDALKEYVLEMLKHHTMSDSDAFKIEGLLYLFFSKLCEDHKETSSLTREENTNNYINKAIEFIQNNYHNSIKVTDIANYICLNRSYLTSIFQSNLNMSPQKFLMKFRITKAAELLYNTDLPIANIAYSCGYSDPLAFSKTFKKIKGVSPKQYRDTKKETTKKFLLSQ